MRVRLGLVAALVLVLAGCGTAQVAGENGSIRIKDDPLPEVAATARYAATVRVLPYADERDTDNPRKIGTGGENIYGFHSPEGTDILIDRDVAEVVTAAMKRQLQSAGYRVVEQGDAHFEMRGSVKELTYNVRARDEVSISVATELKDATNGNVLWSGVVVEKSSRFAGVGGNDIKDVATFLKKEVRVVTSKTNEAISAVLMAQRPELFDLIPGTSPIKGVTVLNPPSKTGGAGKAETGVAQGTLAITTSPARAKIYIDGVYFGLSPLRLQVKPGIVAVSARMAGRKSAEEKVSVRKGQTTELELTLKR